MYCREAPSVVTCSASNRAWTPKTLPVRRCQARQWQIETRTGSPSTVSRSCSQLHSACRMLTSGIVDRVGSGGHSRTLAQPRPLRSHCALRVRSADCVRGWLHDVDDREARVDIEAGGREERGAEVTREE